MPKLTDFSAFIFDMDGLVLDTEPTYRAAWQAALDDMSLRGDENLFGRFSGQHFAAIKAILFAEFGDNFDVHQFSLISSQYWLEHVATHSIPIKPGVKDVLDFADFHNIPVGLATNSSERNARYCLGVANLLERFPIIVTGNDVRHPKPEPDIFYVAAERLNVDIKESIVFEDSCFGIEAAKKSGAYAVYVPSSTPPLSKALERCDWMVESLSLVLQSMPSDAMDRI
jgi:HAD superfamily hydrolase (TIGR01509 family)